MAKGLECVSVDALRDPHERAHPDSACRLTDGGGGLVGAGGDGARRGRRSRCGCDYVLVVAPFDNQSVFTLQDQLKEN